MALWFRIPKILNFSGETIALSVAREREQGIFVQLLVSPLTPEVVTISKAVPAILVALVQVTLNLCTAVFLYRVPFRGSPLMLYGGMLFYALSGGSEVADLVGLQHSTLGFSRRILVHDARDHVVRIHYTHEKHGALPADREAGEPDPPSRGDRERHVPQGHFLQPFPLAHSADNPDRDMHAWRSLVNVPAAHRLIEVKDGMVSEKAFRPAWKWFRLRTHRIRFTQEPRDRQKDNRRRPGRHDFRSSADRENLDVKRFLLWVLPVSQVWALRLFQRFAPADLDFSEFCGADTFAQLAQIETPIWRRRRQITSDPVREVSDERLALCHGQFEEHLHNSSRWYLELQMMP